jgi:8-oxo-dGTP pyrophosphatase MutT (NUDIX family)
VVFYFVLCTNPAPFPANFPMKVFINDIPLLILKSKEKVSKHHYDLVIDAADYFSSKSLVGNVLIRNADVVLVDRLVRLMEVKKLKKLESLTLITDSRKKLVQHMKDHFKIIHAAGGLVIKDDKILMIYRLGHWDLPKGKIKKSEPSEIGGMREVEEECNIKVELLGHITNTWHSYAFKGSKILKKTYWYLMGCLDDSQMRPQIEEFIEDVRFMSLDEVREVLPESYGSIQYVVNHYLTHAPSQKG